MLVLRRRQLDAFERDSMREFHHRMLAHLRDAFGDCVQPMSDPQLLLWVEDRTRESSAWGMEEEADVERYLELCAAYPAMAEIPRAAEIDAILSTPRQAPLTRLDRLHEYLQFPPGV